MSSQPQSGRKKISLIAFLVFVCTVNVLPMQGIAVADPLDATDDEEILDMMRSMHVYKQQEPWSVDAPGEGAPSRMEIPDRFCKEENLYFKSKDSAINFFDLYHLREVTLLNDDLEIRIWKSDYSHTKVFLRRISGKWAGLGFDEDDRRNTATMRVLKPRSDWEAVWGKLTRLGIMDLPDSSLLPVDLQGIFDGVDYTVEINFNNTYRVYSYSNPSLRYWPEAKKLLRISRVLEREFGIKISDLRERGLRNRAANDKVVLVKKGSMYGAFMIQGKDTAPDQKSYLWRYRTDGSSDLAVTGFIEGGPNDLAESDFKSEIKFGSFKLGWSKRSIDEGYVYFPDQKTPADEEPLAIAVSNQGSFENLDAAEHLWNYVVSPADEPEP